MSAPTPADLAAHWLAVARGDLATAEAILEDPSLPPRQAAILAEQAAEKAIKGTLVFLGIEPPRTHDLTLLAALLPPAWQVTPAADELGGLTIAYRASRYPDYFGASISVDETARLIDAASAVVDGCLHELVARGVPSPPPR